MATNFVTLLWQSNGGGGDIVNYPLARLDRIASVKMTVLNKLLCYFRILPIPVPVNVLNTFQIRIFTFVWGSRGCRMARSTLYTPKESGRLGVLDFRKYNIVTQLRYFTHYRPDWVLPWFPRNFTRRS